MDWLVSLDIRTHAAAGDAAVHVALRWPVFVVRHCLVNSCLVAVCAVIFNTYTMFPLDWAQIVKKSIAQIVAVVAPFRSQGKRKLWTASAG